MVLQCCVKGCETIAKNGLHSFPSNRLAAEKWIEATKAFHLINRLYTNTLSHSYYKVCKKHFEQTDFQLNGKGQIVVKSDSIPSLFLPDDADGDVPQTSTHAKKLSIRLQQQNSVAKGNATKPVKENDLVGVGSDCDVDVEVLSSDEEIEPPSSTSKEGRKATDRVAKTTNESRRSYNLSYYKRRVKVLQQKVKNNKLNDSQVLHYLSTKFNAQLYEFVAMQLKNCGRSKHGRRYTPEQKSLCLAMYKQGPKSYRFNERWCCLPTKRTLGRYSAELIFKTGVDTKVLETIKTTVKDWPNEDKLCSFGWDEVSLKQSLEYCYSQDKIEGFVEIMKPKMPIFATHALTFMARGINIAFKQATGYFYTSGLKSFELIELIKIMIESILSTGLVPIMSVCDTCSTNANAVNGLVHPSATSTKQTGDLLMYKINGHQIIHCYDPSHLIKAVRNNFQTKNLAHFVAKRWELNDDKFDGPLQIATWDDVYELFRKDFRSPQRQLIKLTDEHLNPSKLKMKVSIATQVFSNACGTVMLEYVENGKLPEHCTSTAHLLLFMNDLFDSVNGSIKNPTGTLKSAVTPESMHFQFWDYALLMLENMFFVDKLTGERNNKSSVLKKFESTLRGYLEVAKRCFNSNITDLNISECKENFDLMDQNATLESIEHLLVKLNEIIPHICFEESIKQKLVDRVQSINIHVVGCSGHSDEIDRKVKNLAVVQIILTFCNEINNILSGKVQALPPKSNHIHKLALQQRLKKKRIGKHSDIFNEN
ncbi:hypothetical protein HA402_014535 [Bradysia odoriphaga]|nr:hypothetical protein HA402_014535 [Bradysia odoriphaga]